MIHEKNKNGENKISHDSNCYLYICNRYKHLKRNFKFMKSNKYKFILIISNKYKYKFIYTTNLYIHINKKKTIKEIYKIYKYIKDYSLSFKIIHNYIKEY